MKADAAMKRLQIALSPYRAVITSGNVPIPPGRRVQKASSDTQLGRRSAATRSTTSPVVPGGLRSSGCMSFVDKTRWQSLTSFAWTWAC